MINTKSHGFERRSLVLLHGDHRFQNLAFVIDGPPR